MLHLAPCSCTAPAQVPAPSTPATAQPGPCLLLQAPPLRLQLRHFGLQVAGAAGQLAAAGADHKWSTGVMLGCSEQ